jgi:hypothetical protein
LPRVDSPLLHHVSLAGIYLRNFRLVASRASCSALRIYICLYDRVGDEWHDFPTRDCHPSIIASRKWG